MPTLYYQTPRRGPPSPRRHSPAALVLAWLSVGTSLVSWLFLLLAKVAAANNDELGLAAVGNIFFLVAATVATVLLLVLWLTFAADSQWSGRAVACAALVLTAVCWLVLFV